MKYCYHCMKEIEDASIVCRYCKREVNYSVPEHILKPGTILKERYLIGERIGQGGFGITYIGKDLNLSKPIAIKEFFLNGFAVRDNRRNNYVSVTTSEQRAYFEHQKEKFIAEAQIVAQFYNEPSVVDVTDVFRENGTAYIIMSYLEGKNLRDCVADNGLFEPKELFTLMTPIMEVLGRIHEKGIIHRDISPDNIMRLNDGRMVLFDFGAARNYDSNNTMTVILKRGFAPYEQYSSKSEQGPWTDVYALSATMYYCLTGRVPEAALDRMSDPDSVLLGPSAIRAGNGKDISSAVDHFILRGLALRIKERYQTMREMENAFAEALSASGSQEQISLEKLGRLVKPSDSYLFSRYPSVPEADVHCLLGSYDKALEIILEGLRQYPDDFGLNLRASIALNHLGIIQPAYRFNNKCKDLYDCHAPVTNYDYAILMDETGNSPEAMQHYEAEIARIEKTGITAPFGRIDYLTALYLRCAKCAGKLGDPAIMESCIKRALNWNGDAELVRISISSFRQLLHFERANVKKDKGKAKPAPKKDLAEIFALADQYYEIGDYNKCLSILLDALKNEPDNSNLMNKIGRAYSNLGMYQNALEYYEKAMILSPQDPITYSNFGVVYVRQDNYRKAKGYFEKAASMVEANPSCTSTIDTALIFGNYAYALGLCGDMKEARYYLSRASHCGYNKKSIQYICQRIGIDPKPYM